MTDELKQWSEDKAYDRAKVEMLKALQNVREKISNFCAMEPAAYVPNYVAYARCINLIDDEMVKYMGGRQ